MLPTRIHPPLLVIALGAAGLWGACGQGAATTARPAPSPPSRLCVHGCAAPLVADGGCIRLVLDECGRHPLSPDECRALAVAACTAEAGGSAPGQPSSPTSVSSRVAFSSP